MVHSLIDTFAANISIQKRMSKISLFIFFFCAFISLEMLYAQERDSLFFGTLVLDTNLEEFYLIIGNDVPNAVFAESSLTIELPSGKQEITIVGRFIDDYSFELDIPASDTLKNNVFISFYPRSPKSSFYTIQSEKNVQILTDEESVIFLNDEQIGTHYSELFIPNGFYRLKIVHPTHGSLTSKIEVSSLELLEFTRFNQEPSKHLRPLNIIPGFGQVRKQQYLKAGIFLTGVLGLGIAAVQSDELYSEQKGLFNAQFDEYLAARTVADARTLRLRAESTLDDMQQTNNTTRALAIGAVLVYAYSLFDSFQKPKDGYKNSTQLQPRVVVETNPLYNQTLPKLTLAVNF